MAETYVEALISQVVFIDVCSNHDPHGLVRLQWGGGANFYIEIYIERNHLKFLLGKSNKPEKLHWSEKSFKKVNLSSHYDPLGKGAGHNKERTHIIRDLEDIL